mmetsp:Transcript_34694/g.103371  ORF Transcript_34694/g.103371 Transcript_34694/m.103371 type:complete len:297 (-) Transcript_34694:368-1258(-)
MPGLMLGGKSSLRSALRPPRASTNLSADAFSGPRHADCRPRRRRGRRPRRGRARCDLTPSFFACSPLASVPQAMVPCDFKMAGLLTDDKLRTTIRFGEGSSLMFFFDCCHSGTILDLPYTLRHTLSGPEYPIETEAGAVFCISASKDDQSAYETAEGGVCTRAFLGAYTPSVSPAATLRLMRRYAERKGMPQTIMMASNRPFTEADASFVEAEPEGGGGFCAAFHRCQNRLGCSKGRSKAGDFGGENPAARSLELNRGEASGRGPKLHPSCPDPLSTTKGRAYVAARRAKLAAPPP